MEHLLARIQGVEDSRLAAQVAGDWEAVGAVLDERLTYVHSTGRRDGRDSLLDFLSTGPVTFRRAEHALGTIVPIGLAAGSAPEAVMVSGEMRLDITRDGVEKTIRTVTTSIWRHERGGDWKLLGFHATAAP